ncbi:MAG: MerR family transcriptional regulator [Actinomycetota bacterium]|nr:MerR family transcriptional regulator [Actinomycetota bacterium]
MRISELGRASGVAIPTVKYYLREGLLRPGEATAWNQAEYSEEHVRRLRLIRALAEIGGLKLRDIRAVLDAIDRERLSIHDLLGVAHHALGPAASEDDRSREARQARKEVDRFIAVLGWRVSRDAPARRTLARVLLTLREMGWEAGPELFEPYARAVEGLARREVGAVDSGGSRTEAVHQAVVGTIVFEPALLALRRLAQEHHSALAFGKRRRR